MTSESLGSLDDLLFGNLIKTQQKVREDFLFQELAPELASTLAPADIEKLMENLGKNVFTLGGQENQVWEVLKKSASPDASGQKVDYGIHPNIVRGTVYSPKITMEEMAATENKDTFLQEYKSKRNIGTLEDKMKKIKKKMIMAGVMATALGHPGKQDADEIAVPKLKTVSPKKHKKKKHAGKEAPHPPPEPVPEIELSATMSNMDLEEVKKPKADRAVGPKPHHSKKTKNSSGIPKSAKHNPVDGTPNRTAPATPLSVTGGDSAAGSLPATPASKKPKVKIKAPKSEKKSDKKGDKKSDKKKSEVVPAEELKKESNRKSLETPESLNSPNSPATPITPDTPITPIALSAPSTPATPDVLKADNVSKKQPTRTSVRKTPEEAPKNVAPLPQPKKESEKGKTITAAKPPALSQKPKMVKPVEKPPSFAKALLKPKATVKKGPGPSKLPPKVPSRINLPQQPIAKKQAWQESPDPISSPEAKPSGTKTAEEDQPVWEKLRKAHPPGPVRNHRELKEQRQREEIEAKRAKIRDQKGRPPATGVLRSPVTDVRSKLRIVTAMPWFPALDAHTVNVGNVIGVLNDMVRTNTDIQARIEACKMMLYMYRTFQSDMKDPLQNVLQPLLDALATDPDWEVRSYLVALLPKFGFVNSDVMTAIIARLADKVSQVREDAMKALEAYNIFSQHQLEQMMIDLGLLPGPVLMTHRYYKRNRSILDDLYDQFRQKQRKLIGTSRHRAQEWANQNNYKYNQRLAPGYDFMEL
jgi:hypothetical protein